MSGYSPFMQGLLELLDAETEDRLPASVSNRVSQELARLAAREMSVEWAVADVYALVAELYRNDRAKTASALDALVVSHPAVRNEITRTAMTEQGLRLELAQRQMGEKLGFEDSHFEPDPDKEIVAAWQLLQVVGNRV